MGMNLLQTEGKELLGKKIGAFPTDTETAKKIDIMTETASGDVQTFARETVKTPEGRKHFIEYLTSFGAKDSIKMEEKIAETVVSVQEQSRMMDELRARLEILNAGEQKAAAPYDWSAEFTPEQWRERLDDLYRKIDDNDPALLRSSEEYRALKKGLRDARAAVNDKEAFNKEMDKVFSNAGQYLENKRGTTLGKHYGWQRHSAVMHVMATLANRKADMLEPEGLADILGKGVNPQEKLENGMARLGLYLQSIRQEEDPAKADEKRFLLERVLRERGKNSVTRVQLRKQLEKLDAKVEAVTDKSALYSNLRDEISKRVTSHIGLNTQTVAWCKLMGAFEQMARNSTVPQIHEQAENNKVKRVSMLGRIGATALEITTRITDVEKPEKITRQEARVVVAAAAMNQFLLKHGEKDKQALDMFLKDKHTDEDLLESFRGSNDIVLLAHARGNDKLRKMVCTGTARELMGVNGKRYALGKMKSDLEQKRITQIPKLQPARNNSMGKGMP